MGNTLRHDTGAFCWAELMTSDAADAKRFYSAVMGWLAEDDPIPGGGVYTMLRLAGKDVCALYGLTEEQRTEGVPPHWQPYVTVEDAAAAAARAAGLGGTILKDAFQVMTVGSMAVLQDPLGATFSVWEPIMHTGYDYDDDRPGTACWNEVTTSDSAKAGAFYAELFGWTRESVDMPDGPYTVFRDGKKMRAGMLEARGPLADMPPAWLTYFSVADCDATARLVQDKGGTEMLPPTDIPGLGRYAITADPQGACFCFIQKHG